MEKTSDDLVVEAREWSMNKINSDIPMENVKAIYEEFQEWIDAVSYTHLTLPTKRIV